jgi:hypothetical protein
MAGITGVSTEVIMEAIMGVTTKIITDAFLEALFEAVWGKGQHGSLQ